MSTESIVAAAVGIAICAFFGLGDAGCSTSTPSSSDLTNATPDAAVAVVSTADPSPVGDAAAPVALTHGTDNAAIVEISTMMLAGSINEPALDQYNLEDPFVVKSTSYASTFAQRLATFDKYDGATDWDPVTAGTWVTRVSSGNYLVVDPSKPCDFDQGHTYLEIERAAFAGTDHQTCGGRTPNEDSFDVTLNFLVRSPKGLATDTNALHDGVEQATAPSTSTFPYLAEMNTL